MMHIQELQEKINKLTKIYILTDNKNIIPENISPSKKHIPNRKNFPVNQGKIVF